MKRFLALALSLLMLFSLVACSGNTAPAADADNTWQTETTAPETPDNAEQPQESTETVTGEPKWLADDTSISGTVRFWIPFKGEQGMNDLIAEFNQAYPNITVELTPYSNNTDGNTAVNTSLMSGEIDAVRLVGPIEPATKRGFDGLRSV